MLENFVFWLFSLILWLFLTPAGHAVFCTVWLLAFAGLIYVALAPQSEKGGDNADGN